MGETLSLARRLCQSLACGYLPPVALPSLPPVVGAELDKLGAAEFCAAARRATVLGKLTPGQKARVVAALKGVGHTGA